MIRRSTNGLALLIGSIALSLIPKNAAATCLNADWSHGIGRPDHGAIYFGTIGTHAVRMMLHLDAATGRLDGVYGYNDQPEELTLTGNLRADGTGADLNEHDTQGRVTGHFSLNFIEHREPWEDPIQYKRSRGKFLQKCDAPLGTWWVAPGSAPLKVVLHRNGEWTPAYDGEEQLDEVAAFKLRKAMLEGNRRAFASLLKYPFYTTNERGSVTTWSNREEVIKHYDDIVPMWPDALRNAVPHVLESGPTGAIFMGGSIYLSHGKVTMMCDGRCPVVANLGRPVL